jgi:hypothetical protein
MSDLPKISLLKRDNGFWYVLYEDSGRVRWKSTHTRSREGALKAVMRLKEFLRPKPETAPLLSNFSKDLLEYTGSTFAAKTTIMYEAVLKRLQKVAGDLLLSELTSKHLDLYSAERLKTIKPVSVNIEIGL